MIMVKSVLSVFGQLDKCVFNKKILRYNTSKESPCVLQMVNDRIVEGPNSLYPLLKHVFLYDLSGNETIKEEDLSTFKIENDLYLTETKRLGGYFVIRVIFQKKDKNKYHTISTTLIEIDLYPENRSKEKLQRLLKYIETELPRYTDHV